jgi:ribonuclease HI
MSESPELTIYTDGGSRGNPGPAAYAYVIERAGESDIEEKAFLGRTTNNIAEYTGLVKALEHARHLGATRITVFSDSELMVKQMNGDYRVKNEGLLPLYQQAVQLRKDFQYAAIRHIRREHNQHADRLCNEAMDRPADHQPFPLPLPPRAPAASAPPVTERKVMIDDVREQAVEILSTSARQWAQGNPASPAPAEVWDEIWRLLVKSKTVRSRRKRKTPNDA